jgi:hypothetical protein
MASTEYMIQRLRPRREGGGSCPLGPIEDVRGAFARLNTGSDSTEARVLHGPGLRVHLHSSSGLVDYIELRVTEEELFELLFEGTKQSHPGPLAKLVRAQGWQLVNTETGYTYPVIRDEDDDDDA